MIIWINGAFGAGKTTTANLVVDRLDGAKIFDPEYVGFLLTRFVEAPTGDFQDLPLWRHLVVQTMTGLAQQYPYPWVVPMALINAAYRSEILDGIRAGGVDVREFVLTLPEAPLRARIEADQVDAQARQWRQDHVMQALATFASLNDATLVDATAADVSPADVTFVDATQPPEQVAEAVVRRVRVRQVRG